MLNIQGMLDALGSAIQELGYYDNVTNHEPKNAPGNGLTAAIWVQSLSPVAMASGLDATSVRVEVTIRSYNGMLDEPQDAIDPNLTEAVDAVMAAISGAFTLGGIVRDVDLLGAHGRGLSMQAGYLNQAGKIYRVMDICLPMIVNDNWAQVA